jgi:N-acetyltransferase
MNFPFEQEIVLENDRSLIRPLQINDVENLLLAATADKNLVQYSPLPIYTKELLQQYIEIALEERKNKLRYPFVLFDKKTDAFGGSSSYMNISAKDKRLEIGNTWIGPAFHRTGFNRNNKYLMLSFVFDLLGYERLELKTDERNLQSRAAIEKIGGQFEGIFRSHMVMADGFRRNTVYYSILKNEWPGIKNKLEKSIADNYTTAYP